MELTVGTETRREYLSFELARSARKMVEEVMPVKPGENVVITADTKSDARVVEATAQAVYALGAHPVVIWHETLPEANMEPPPPVAAALAAANVWFEYNVASILYTEARLQAIYAGCRHACYGAMDVDMMVRTIGRVNYPAMQKLEEKLEELSQAATEMHITSMTFEHRRDNSTTETWNYRFAHERANFGPKPGLNRSRKAILDIRIAHRVGESFQLCN